MTEIGIAVEDVSATSEALREAVGASVYWGGGDGLTAIGDAVGAVLVSPVGRGWIPTGLPAVPAPTTIVAEGSPAGRMQLPGGPYVVEAAQVRSWPGASLVTGLTCSVNQIESRETRRDSIEA